MKNWNRIKNKFFKMLNTSETELMERPDYIYSNETNEIEVTAQPIYIRERSFPEKNFYFFSYHIEINNHSAYSCRLLRRNWFIKNGNGTANEIEGPGVIGQTPIINPGQKFEYTSYCHLPTPCGNMRGQYLFEWCESGEKFNVEIPLFFLRLPETFTATPQTEHPNLTI